MFFTRFTTRRGAETTQWVVSGSRALRAAVEVTR